MWVCWHSIHSTHRTHDSVPIAQPIPIATLISIPIRIRIHIRISISISIPRTTFSRSFCISLVKFFNLAICYGTLAVLHIETGHGTLAWSLLCATCCCNITASTCLNSCRIFMQGNVVDSKKMPQRDGERERRGGSICASEREGGR